MTSGDLAATCPLIPSGKWGSMGRRNTGLEAHAQGFQQLRIVRER
jgi:hypothetical protein